MFSIVYHSFYGPNDLSPIARIHDQCWDLNLRLEIKIKQSFQQPTSFPHAIGTWEIYI